MGADKNSGLSFLVIKKLLNLVNTQKITNHNGLKNKLKVLQTKKAFICELIMDP